MKKLLLTLFSLTILFACDNDFTELNTNPVDPTAIDPVFELNQAIIQTSYPGANLVYNLGIVQQIITPNSGVLTGANFNQDNRNSTDDYFTEYYRDVIRHTKDIIFQTTDTPERNNLRQMARIWQANAFMILTDTYGDIPYSEAGLGFIDQTPFPAYDTQESIYTDLIAELTEASMALTAGGNIETADILYGGDVAKWRKLGYSLLLRAGMRLSKVNVSLAQSTVAAAFNGGVFESNEDNAAVQHNPNFRNGNGNTLNGTEANNYYLAAPFVDFLQDTDDPRLGSIAIRYVGAASGPEQQDNIATTDPSLQIGLPMGNDDTGAAAAAAADGLASFYDYSQANRNTVGSPFAPQFIITHAQTQLLLAEAAERGWITGDAATFFQAGVRAHMEQFAAYGESSIIPEGDINAYISANPYQAGAGALEQINNQYWVASFFNGPEAFANFRRSGFPDLAPNPFPGPDLTSENFIRRLTYPTDEIAVNNDNLQAAVSRQGADVLDTRVWWDVAN